MALLMYLMHIRTYARTYVHIHLEYYSWINLQMKGNNCVIVHVILQKWMKKRGEGGGVELDRESERGG